MPGTSALDSSLSTNLILVMQWVTAAIFPLPPTSSSSFAASAAYLPMCPPHGSFEQTSQVANLFPGPKLI